MELKSEGKCRYCNNVFSGSTMTTHLKSCRSRKNINEAEIRKEKIFLMKASEGPFWVYFEVNANLTLKEIDKFLRSLWLECCGHLSVFLIKDKRYYSQEMELEPGEKTMEYKISSVIRPGASFFHEYDFGTTTQLQFKCISEREGDIDNIDIVARNDLPNFSCYECKKPAEEICTYCIWYGRGLFCKKCAKKHECEEESFLPVVNSPRMGMCGYTGD